MSKKTLSATLSTAVIASLSLSPILNAQENPFAMKDITGSQRFAEAGEKAKEGKCGEGKCSSSRKMKEGGCSGAKMKEGACGADKIKEGGCSGNAKGQAVEQPKR